jgi:hypothetical protein
VREWLLSKRDLKRRNSLWLVEVEAIEKAARLHLEPLHCEYPVSLQKDEPDGKYNIKHPEPRQSKRGEHLPAKQYRDAGNGYQCDRA